MSDAKNKIRTCAQCPHYNEPVCAKLRPCEKSLPVCADFPASQTIGIEIVGSLPTIYLGLMQDSPEAFVYPYMELAYTGYRRAEMCCLDWDWLIKVPVSPNNPSASGFYRRFCHSPKAGKGWRVGYDNKCAVFSADGGDTLGSQYNTATNGTPVQFSKAMQPWVGIKGFGLFLEEKGGCPEHVFATKKKLTVDTNKHATFMQGSIEIPVAALISMKLKSTFEGQKDASV